MRGVNQQVRGQWQTATGTTLRVVDDSWTVEAADGSKLELQEVVVPRPHTDYATLIDRSISHQLHNKEGDVTAQVKNASASDLINMESAGMATHLNISAVEQRSFVNSLEHSLSAQRPAVGTEAGLQPPTQSLS